MLLAAIVGRPSGDKTPSICKPSAIMPPVPKAVAERIHGLAERGNNQTAFLLGGLTFFLPCGFTQALQLYVLAKGDVLTGGLIMLAFALGTLPALLSLSALSSFAKGVFQRRFLKIAGAAVVVLGLLNIQSGLVLSGIGHATLPLMSPGAVVHPC